jgi:ABC-type uncharacterized transport system ATPase subunit
MAAVEQTHHSTMAAPPVLTATGVSKSFGPVVANDAVSLELYAGEIHAVVGENGAGKTTLMRILSGSMAPDEGVLSVRGTEVSFASPVEARRQGIGMVYQHYSVVPGFSVLDNLLLSVAGSSAKLISRNERTRAVEFLEQEGYRDPAVTLVGDLAVDEVQRFEIAKLRYNGAQVLILDEPTAVLGPIEVTRLYQQLRDLADRDHTIVVITHKLAEVEQHADRVTVMRGGTTVIGSVVPPSRTELLKAMFGDHVNTATHPPHVPPRSGSGSGSGDPAPVLEVRDLHVNGADGRTRVKGVGFVLLPGEVLAVLGVEGNGQSHLMDALAGLTAARGEIRLDGRNLTGLSARRRHELGVRAVTEDRHRWDVFMEASMTENLLVHRVAASSPLRHTNTRGGALGQIIQDAITRFDVRPRNPRLAMSKFSGGNQQRAVIARESEGTKRVLLLAHPTRGLDVVGSARITESVAEQAADNVAVVWNTADIDEAFAVSNRMLVMCDGRVTLFTETAAATREQVALAMSGAEVA